MRSQPDCSPSHNQYKENNVLLGNEICVVRQFKNLCTSGILSKYEFVPALIVSPL